MAAAAAWLLYLFVGVVVWSVSKLFCKKIRKQKKDEGLSLAQAIEKADRLKLFKVKRDPHTHLPIFGTQRRFGFMDAPEVVGFESVGLGFYFFHLNQFLVILGILSITYFINVTQYYNKVNFEGSYTLKFSASASGEQSKNTTCNRPYDTSTLITRISAGSLCVDQSDSNAYFCPAVCTVSLLNESVADVDLVDPMVCRKHKPCAISGNKAGCCVNELAAENNHFPFLSIWMMAFGIILFSGWLAYCRIVSDRLGERLNSSVITASDYTVLVTGIDKKGCTQTQLTDFFRHYGSIYWSTPVPRIGSVIAKKTELEMLLEMEREIGHHSKETLNTVTVSGILFMLAYLGLPFFLRATFTGVEKAIEAKKAWIKSRTTVLRKKIEKAQEKAVEDVENHRNTGQALVTYSYENFAKNAFNDQNRPVAKAVSKYTTCNLVSRYPKLQGRGLKVHRAPEPSDFRWENTNTFGSNRKVRILISTSLTLLVLAAGALIQLQLEIWKADAINDFSEYKVASADARDDNEFLLKQLRVRSLSTTSSFVIVIVNMVMHVIAGALSRFERWHSWSDTEKYLLLKLSTAYFLNTSVIPLLASTPENWYTEGGFAEQVFYTQLIDAVMAPMLALFDPTWLCSRLSCQYAKTQDVLDKILVPPEFSLSIRYSDTIKTLSMAVMFAPMVPTSPLIGFCGIAIQCATDRVIAFKMAQRPRQLQEGVMEAVFFLLRFIPPLQLGLMYYCFTGIRNLLIGAAGVWLAASLYTFLKGTQRTKEMEDAGTGGLSFKDASESCDLSTDQVENNTKSFEDFFFSTAETEDSLGEKINAIFSEDTEEFQDCEDGEAGDVAGEGEGARERTRTERIKSNIKQKYFTYNPLTMCELEGDLREKIQGIFDVDAGVCPPNQELMLHQKPETGGPGNTSAPGASQSRRSRKSSVFKQISALESNLKTHRRSRAASRRKTVMSIFRKVNTTRKSLVGKLETPNPLFSATRRETKNQLSDNQL